MASVSRCLYLVTSAKSEAGRARQLRLKAQSRQLAWDLEMRRTNSVKDCFTRPPHCVQAHNQVLYLREVMKAEKRRTQLALQFLGW